MSNDHYYVVIVPHADQAAQALSTARVAGHVHVARHETVTKHGSVGASAATRVAATAATPHGGSAAPRGARAARGSGRAAPRTSGEGKAGGPNHRVRAWSVVVGDQKYDVTDFGPTCGYRIAADGVVVWTGVLSERGHDTHTTTLPADTLNEVLRLAYVGDRREAAKVVERAPAAPPSSEPKSETRVRPARTAEVTPKRSATASASAGPPSGDPKQGPKARRSPKPKPTEPAPKPKAEREAKPKAEREAKPKAEREAKPKAEREAKPKAEREAKRGTKPKAASPRNGPLTQRTPAAHPSAKPQAHRGEPTVDDKAVLDGLMEKLRAEDPSTAEQSFAPLKRIWLAGGREATVEWMKHHAFPSAVAAFGDWLEKNLEAAQSMLHKAPHSAKVA